MEFLEGETLQKLINDKGLIPEVAAVAHIKAVFGALEQVHAAGLIHRDIKPDNICVTTDGRTVLIDFGTARAFALGKTVKQTAMLTPGYAPLEQYGQQARFGAFSDIYALGATLYHCLTGQMPAPATDRVAGVEVAPPHQLNPSVSLPVSWAVMRAMQIKASERPQNVGEFLAELNAPAATPPSEPQPPPPRSANDIHMAPDGSGDFSTLAQAIAHAPSGATIYLEPGIYQESLRLDKDLHLVGALFAGAERPVFESGVGNVCKIEGGRGTMRGIFFRGVAGEEGKRFFGLNAVGGEWELHDCQAFSDSLAALRIGGEATLTLRACRFKSDKMDGVLIEGGHTCHIFDSVIHKNGRHGVYQKVAPQSPTRLHQTQCEGNRGSGVIVSEGHIDLSECSLALNLRAGLELEGESHAEVSRCRLTQNGAQGLIAGQGVTGNMTSESRLFRGRHRQTAPVTLESDQEGARPGVTRFSCWSFARLVLLRVFPPQAGEQCFLSVRVN